MDRLTAKIVEFWHDRQMLQSYGGSQSIWLTDNRIVGFLNQKSEKYC
jgi:hypothetical protein